MTFDQKKPGVAFWATLALVAVLVAYPLSFGPACWWFSPIEPPDIGYSAIQYHIVPRFYWPMGWLAKHGPNAVRRSIVWYATLSIDHVKLPCNPSGTSGLDT